MRRAFLGLALAILTAGCFSSGDDQTTTVDRARLTQADVLAASAQSAPAGALDRLIAKLPSVAAQQGGKPVTLYLWEGDMLLTRERLAAILTPPSASAQAAKGDSQNKSTGIPDSYGRAIRWPPGRRALTYFFDRHSFRNQQEADYVLANFRQAASDWERVCPECGVTIREVPGNALFVVRYEPYPPVRYHAAAFFPYDGPDRRVVNVTPSFFQMPEPPAGVLRHEIGHILGLLHEQIRGRIPGCDYEAGYWIPLTQYERRSIMHYPCSRDGGEPGGTPNMQITALDAAGYRGVYLEQRGDGS